MAMLPRATFYNYFDDKYDLLEYCFMTVRDRLDSGYSLCKLVSLEILSRKQASLLDKSDIYKVVRFSDIDHIDLF